MCVWKKGVAEMLPFFYALKLGKEKKTHYFCITNQYIMKTLQNFDRDNQLKISKPKDKPYEANLTFEDIAPLLKKIFI